MVNNSTWPRRTKKRRIHFVRMYNNSFVRVVENIMGVWQTTLQLAQYPVGETKPTLFCFVVTGAEWRVLLSYVGALRIRLPSRLAGRTIAHVPPPSVVI